jgi:Protein of unknown function (DUF1573)
LNLEKRNDCMTAPLKTFSLLLLCCLSGLSASAQLNLSSGEPTEETTIAFDQTEYDLGTLTTGDTVKAVFRFKNAGQAPLVIEHVKPSCVCTQLDFPEKPIAPGAYGEISAAIDTEDKEGEQTKYFSVIYNGNPPVERITLRFVVTPGKKND